MTIEETRQKIMTNDEFVLQELEQFLHYYNLKHTLRWGHNNKTKDASESVADHIYAMQILATYFQPFYTELDALRISQLILWHDMAEALVDDVITNRKTDDDREAEILAEQQLTINASPHLQESLSELFLEYNEQTTIESKFVKAIDKIEPNLHMYFLSQKSNVTRTMLKAPETDWTSSACRQHQGTYLTPFPMLERFYNFVVEEARLGGFYTDSPC